MKIITIDANDAGQRMDKFLLKYFKNATNGFLRKMMRKKNITLNKTKADGTELLKAGDEVYVFFSDETFDSMRGLAASGGDFELLRTYYQTYQPVILYEDADYLACDKPAGMRSQKNTPTDISINEYLLSYLIHKGDLDLDAYSRFKPSVVNRLDTNTTGILLFAKTYPGARHLTEAIRTRQVDKYYLAVASGVIDRSMTLDGYLRKDGDSNLVTVQPRIPAGEAADYDRILTEIAPVSCDGVNTLLYIKLITGKSHQIRAHLSSIGHPIIGDRKYGEELINQKYRSLGVKSQLLHAYRVVLDGRTITCPPPAVFQKVIHYGDLELQRTQGLGL